MLNKNVCLSICYEFQVIDNYDLNAFLGESDLKGLHSISADRENELYSFAYFYTLMSLFYKRIVTLNCTTF